jgi:hypothetical protein
MGKTHKDLKSHKKGFGRYGFNKPKRKMTPLLLSAEKITGKKGNNLSFETGDISQDGFMYDEKNPRRKKAHHWHNAKAVRAIRRQEREERKQENQNARSSMKRHLKKTLNELK